MTPAESKALADCLNEDERSPMQAPSAPGALRPDTLKTATAKAIAGGVSLKAIFAAIVAGYLQGGMAGAIAAVLALIVAP